MEHTEPDLEKMRVGPMKRPDDPFAAARRLALRSPLTTPERPSDRAKESAPPTSDQEGCYFLG